MPKITFKNPQGPTSLPIVIECKKGMTILDVAEECGARVGHACGGNLACSTCHVYVEEGLDSLAEVHDKENDIMDRAFDVRQESRLGCQAKVAGEDLVIEITQESLQAWLDENPDERKKIAQQKAAEKAASAPPRP